MSGIEHRSQMVDGDVDGDVEQSRARRYRATHRPCRQVGRAGEVQLHRVAAIVERHFDGADDRSRPVASVADDPQVEAPSMSDAFSPASAMAARSAKVPIARVVLPDPRV